MKLTISSASTILLQKAATQNPQSNPNQEVMTQKDIQNLRDNIRQQIRAGLEGANAQTGVTVGQAPPVPPVPPDNPRVITVRNSDGTQTVIGVPAGLARDVIPQQVVDISIAFFLTMAAIIIGLPLARAFARRMDRRATQQIPSDLSHQIGQLNQAVDAIALEVERISEGQRFTTRLLSEQRDAARQTLPTSTPR
jgi:hypothetical protein